jgi:hypothetical protein
VFSFILYQKYFNKTYSVYDFLTYYGFDAQQKNSLENLFKESLIIEQGQSWKDLFLKRDNEEDLIFDILNMIQLTQEKFVVRSGTKERWEVAKQEWIKNNKDETLSDLKILGFIDSIKPKIQFFDAVCILGATGPKMKDRIDYANFLIESGLKVKNIILLAGERYVTKNIDGKERELIELAKKLNINDWQKLTETDLISDLYNKSDLYNRNLAYHLIDTLAMDLPRPTTQTTIIELIKFLNAHREIRNIIFISNQPYVKYQESVIRSVFDDFKINVNFEVVGSSYSDIKDLQKPLEGLGSYIWAECPNALSKMNLKINDSKIREKFSKIYLHNPLIYKVLPKNFK